jgi:hypothetical protein
MGLIQMGCCVWERVVRVRNATVSNKQKAKYGKSLKNATSARAAQVVSRVGLRIGCFRNLTKQKFHAVVRADPAPKPMQMEVL